MKQFVFGLFILIIALIVATITLVQQQVNVTPNRTGAPPVAPAATILSALPKPHNTNRASDGFASGSKEYFEIDQRATSAELSDIVLSVRSAERLPDALALTIAFENSTNEPIEYSFISGLDSAFVRLSDAAGNQYEPKGLTNELAAIQPKGGFAPGGANVGQLQFPVPSAGAPYRLSGLFDFGTVEFGLDVASSIHAPPTVPSNEYLIFTSLFSDHEVLGPLGLNVNTVSLDMDRITFHVAFVNATIRNFGLRSGPTGADAWLIDADGRQYRPLDVSESLTTGITPEGGLAPDESQMGTISFARPNALQELRFVFQEYTPLALRFDEHGLVDAQLASSAQGVPLAAPTPHPEIVAYRTLTELLSQQADAVFLGNAGSVDAYLETVTADLRNNQHLIFERLTRMPLESYRWELDRKTNFAAAQTGQLTDVEVRLHYQLAGIPADNGFVHDFRMDFQQEVDGWRITRMEALENPPFWWGGDFVFYNTEHFILFARPTADLDIGQLQDEVESAYALLLGKELPLESRYVAYITDVEDNFSLLTGMAGERYLGVAYSRFNIDDEGIDVISRAIYLNGKQFADQAIASERQSTITHELVHLAFAHDSRPYTPIWLVEGLAVYYAEQESIEQRDRLITDGQLDVIGLEQLSALESLGEHDLVGESTSYRYIYSGATVHYLIKKFGEEQLRNFYRSYAEVSIREVRDLMASANPAKPSAAVFGPLSRKVTENQLNLHFGIGLDELDVLVKNWIANGGE